MNGVQKGGGGRSVIAHPRLSVLALFVPQIAARPPLLDGRSDLALGVAGGGGVGALGGSRDARLARDVMEMILDEKGAQGEREQILAAREGI
jgi:hypothetical protein